MSTHDHLVTIGGITFDRVRYDAEADVLYLHVGDPATAVDFDETPEGHHIRLDARAGDGEGHRARRPRAKADGGEGPELLGRLAGAGPGRAGPGRKET